jgi:hypothetical protein
MWIGIACWLDFQSTAQFWKNDEADIRAARIIQYNLLQCWVYWKKA